MGKREDLLRTIERAERALAKLDALPNFDELCDGSVVAIVVEHGRYGNVSPYVGLKMDGRWSFTGGGPDGVSGDALEDWLISSGRKVASATKVAEIDSHSIKVPTVNLGESLLGTIQEYRAPEVCGDPDCGCGLARA